MQIHLQDNEDREYLHHILVDDLGIVNKDLSISDRDSDSLIRECRVCLAVLQEIAVQWLCDCMKFDQSLQIGDIGCDVGAACLQEGLVIWREAGNVLSDIQRSSEACPIKRRTETSHPPSTNRFCAVERQGEKSGCWSVLNVVY